MVDGSMNNMNRAGGCVIHRRSKEEGGNGGRKKGGAGGVCAICLRERLEALYLSSLVINNNNDDNDMNSSNEEGEAAADEEEEEEAASPNGHRYYYKPYNPSPPPPAAFQPPPPPFSAAHSLLSPSPIFDDRLPSTAPRRPSAAPFAFPRRRSFTGGGGASPLRHLRHLLLFPPPPPSDDLRRLRPPLPPDPPRRSSAYLVGSPSPAIIPDPSPPSDSRHRNRTPADHHRNPRRDDARSPAAAASSPSPSSSYAFIHTKNHSHRRNSTYVHWIASLFHRKKHDRSRCPHISKADRFIQNLPAFVLPSTASAVDSSSTSTSCAMLPARASVDSAMPYRRSSSIASSAFPSVVMPHTCVDDHRNAASAMFRKYDGDSACAEDISDARVMVSSIRNSNSNSKKKTAKKQNSKHKMQIWQTSPMFDDDSIFAAADFDHGRSDYCRRSVGGDPVEGGYGAGNASPNWAASPAADRERLQRSRSSSAQMQRVVPEPEHFVKMHGRFDSWIATPFRLIVSRRQQGTGKHL